MPLSMYSASVPAFLQTLSALSAILDKAAAHCAAKKIEPSVLLNTRLAPDMFQLSRQVQLACDFAKNAMVRVGGADLPKFVDEEKTIDELKTRIAKTIDAIKSVKREQIDGTEGKDVTFPTGPQSMTLPGEQYLINYALPNFYFHASTAYNILRHCGIEIGKRDFLGR